MTATAAILSDRSVLEIAGEERASFLQGLVTNDVAGLGAGEACFAGLLSPQGKILFDFLAINAGDTILLDCPAGCGGGPSQAAHLLQAARQGYARRCLGQMACSGGLGRGRRGGLETSREHRVRGSAPPRAGFSRPYRGRRRREIQRKFRRLRRHAHRRRRAGGRQGLRLWRYIPARGLLRPAERRELHEGLLRWPGGRLADAAPGHGAHARAGRIGGGAAAGRRGGHSRGRLRGGPARLGCRRPGHRARAPGSRQRGAGEGAAAFRRRRCRDALRSKLGQLLARWRREGTAH